jgi:hypothetical protein
MAIPRGVAREIGAIMQALTFAVEMGFLDLILEGSHALPFMVSRRGNQEQSVAEMWMEDIVILKQRCHRIEVLAVPTGANQAVVNLVGHPSFCTEEQVWLEDYPVEIQGFCNGFLPLFFCLFL